MYALSNVVRCAASNHSYLVTSSLGCRAKCNAMLPQSRSRTCMNALPIILSLLLSYYLRKLYASDRFCETISYLENALHTARRTLASVSAELLPSLYIFTSCVFHPHHGRLLRPGSPSLSPTSKTKQHVEPRTQRGSPENSIAGPLRMSHCVDPGGLPPARPDQRDVR